MDVGRPSSAHTPCLPTCADPPPKRYPALGYLHRRSAALLPDADASPPPAVADDVSEPDDPSVLEPARSTARAVAVYEYVVYSATFRVPALYFAVHDACMPASCSLTSSR